MSEECPYCDREFETRRGLGGHINHKHEGKAIIPEDELYQLYHERGLSQREIADELDCSQGMVQKAMKTYGMASQKSRSNPTKPPNHKFISYDCGSIGVEYEEVQTTIDYKRYAVRLHRLIAVAHGKLAPSEMWNTDIVVHHKNGHGLDNRPENIEVMERGEHQTMHLKERYSDQNDKSE
jgi:hypothetical protein